MTATINKIDAFLTAKYEQGGEWTAFHFDSAPCHQFYKRMDEFLEKWHVRPIRCPRNGTSVYQSLDVHFFSKVKAKWKYWVGFVL